MSLRNVSSFNFDGNSSLKQFANDAGSLMHTEDPRASGSFGIRSLFHADMTIGVIGSRLSAMGLREGSAADYQRYRLLLGLAEGHELADNIPLEFNQDLLGSISFNKGCYLGQELTARTKYKGLVRKRLVPFALAAPTDASSPDRGQTRNTFPVLDVTRPPSTDAVTDAPIVGGKVYVDSETGVQGGPDGKAMGQIVSVYKDCGLGLAVIRLQSLVQPADPRSAHSFMAEAAGGGRLPIFPFKPHWWPEEDPVTGRRVLEADGVET